MDHPTAGQRVWVRGCAEEFNVMSINYKDGMATIRLVSDKRTVLEAAFHLLSPNPTSPGAVSDASSRCGLPELIRSSQQCVHHATVAIKVMREAVLATEAAVLKSRAILSECDQDIAHMQTLGCNRQPT